MKARVQLLTNARPAPTFRGCCRGLIATRPILPADIDPQPGELAEAGTLSPFSYYIPISGEPPWSAGHASAAKPIDGAIKGTLLRQPDGGGPASSVNVKLDRHVRSDVIEYIAKEYPCKAGEAAMRMVSPWSAQKDGSPRRRRPRTSPTSSCWIHLRRCRPRFERAGGRRA